MSNSVRQFTILSLILLCALSLAALAQQAPRKGPQAEEPRSFAGAYLIRVDIGAEQPALLLAVVNQDGTFQANAIRSLSSQITFRNDFPEGLREGRQHLGSWKVAAEGGVHFTVLNLSVAEAYSAQTPQSGAILKTSGSLRGGEESGTIAGELFQQVFAESDNPMDANAVPLAELGPFSFTGRRIPAEELSENSISPRGQEKLDVCHIAQGNGNVIRISIADPSFPAHVKHGDYVVPTFYEDADGDGVGNPSVAVTQCIAPEGYVPAENGEDCNDAASSCTSDCTTDADGDGRPDCSDRCLDADGDGYGDDNSATVVGSGPFSVGECTTDGSTACDIGPACLGTDCNDADAAINPGATEVCDFIDNNCDSMIDEGFDQDNDGHTTCGGDCNDNDDTVFPGAADAVCNGVDNDCDGMTDEDYMPTPTMCGVGECADTGTLVCTSGMVEDTCTPGSPQPENCVDGLDNDCDGLADEAEDCPVDPVAVNDQYLDSCILLPIGGGQFSRTFTIPAPGVLANDINSVSAVSANQDVVGGLMVPWSPPGPQMRTCTADHLCTTDANFVSGSLTIHADGSVDITYTTSANLTPGANVIAEFLYKAVDGFATQSDPGYVEVFCTVN